jgi:hypothetical protein
MPARAGTDHAEGVQRAPANSGTAAPLITWEDAKATKETDLMRINFARLSVLTVLISALGLMTAFAASASADSISCSTKGSIKLSPGLSETPTVQNVQVKGTLSSCSGTETEVKGGKYNAHLKTTEAITCAALSSSGAAETPESGIILKWTPHGSGLSAGTFSMPLTELLSTLSGKITSGPFNEDTISGNVLQSYSGKCGESSGKHKAKKVKNGTYSGSITVS